MSNKEANVAQRSMGTGLDVRVESGAFLGDETCAGAAYSPEITVNGLSAPYIALIMDEAEEQQGGFSYWLLWNAASSQIIPRNIPKSAEVDHPIRALQGRNSLDEIGYSAPCPPKEGAKHLVLRIYGLDSPIEAHAASTRKELERKMDGHIVQYGQTDIDLRPIVVGQRHWDRTSR